MAEETDIQVDAPVEDEVSKLYRLLKSDEAYKDGIPKTEEEFRSAMDKPDQRKKVYDALREDADYKDIYKSISDSTLDMELGFKKKVSTTSPADGSETSGESTATGTFELDRSELLNPDTPVLHDNTSTTGLIATPRQTREEKLLPPKGEKDFDFNKEVSKSQLAQQKVKEEEAAKQSFALKLRNQQTARADAYLRTYPQNFLYASDEDRAKEKQQLLVSGIPADVVDESIRKRDEYHLDRLAQEQYNELLQQHQGESGSQKPEAGKKIKPEDDPDLKVKSDILQLSFQAMSPEEKKIFTLTEQYERLREETYKKPDPEKYEQIGILRTQLTELTGNPKEFYNPVSKLFDSDKPDPAFEKKVQGLQMLDKDKLAQRYNTLALRFMALDKQALAAQTELKNYNLSQQLSGTGSESEQKTLKANVDRIQAVRDEAYGEFQAGIKAYLLNESVSGTPHTLGYGVQGFLNSNLPSWAKPDWLFKTNRAYTEFAQKAFEDQPGFLNKQDRERFKQTLPEMISDMSFQSIPIVTQLVVANKIGGAIEVATGLSKGLQLLRQGSTVDRIYAGAIESIFQEVVQHPTGITPGTPTAFVAADKIKAPKLTGKWAVLQPLFDVAVNGATATGAMEAAGGIEKAAEAITKNKSLDNVYEEAGFHDLSDHGKRILSEYVLGLMFGIPGLAKKENITFNPQKLYALANELRSTGQTERANDVEMKAAEVEGAYVKFEETKKEQSANPFTQQAESARTKEHELRNQAGEREYRNEPDAAKDFNAQADELNKKAAEFDKQAAEHDKKNGIETPDVEVVPRIDLNEYNYEVDGKAVSAKEFVDMFQDKDFREKVESGDVPVNVTERFRPNIVVNAGVYDDIVDKANEEGYTKTEESKQQAAAGGREEEVGSQKPEVGKEENIQETGLQKVEPIKPKPNAVQEPGTEEILQREQAAAPGKGGERGRVEPIKSGDETPGAPAKKEEKPKSPDGKSPAEEEKIEASPPPSPKEKEPVPQASPPEKKVNKIPAATNLNPEMEKRRGKSEYTEDGITYKRQQPVSDENVITGKAGVSTFSPKDKDNVQVPFHYALTTLENVQPTQKGTQVNKLNFIPESQPKPIDTGRDIENKKRGEHFDQNEMTVSGTDPFRGFINVNPRMEVFQGTGRWNIRNYNQNEKERIEHLKAIANETGITGEQIDEFAKKNPGKKLEIVKVHTVSDQEAIKLGQYGSGDRESTPRGTEEAQKVGKITPETKQRLSTLLANEVKAGKRTAEIITSRGNDIVNILAGDGVLSATELARYRTEGELNAEGQGFLNRIFTAMLLNKNEKARTIFYDLPSKVQKAVEKFGGYLLSIPEKDNIDTDVLSAMVALNRYEKSGYSNITDWSRQVDAASGLVPQDEFTPLQIEIAKRLGQQTENQTGAMLKDYFESIYGNNDLFNPKKPKSRSEAVEEVFDVPWSEKKGEGEKIGFVRGNEGLKIKLKEQEQDLIDEINNLLQEPKIEYQTGGGSNKGEENKNIQDINNRIAELEKQKENKKAELGKKINQEQPELFAKPEKGAGLFSVSPDFTKLNFNRIFAPIDNEINALKLLKQQIESKPQEPVEQLKLLEPPGGEGDAAAGGSGSNEPERIWSRFLDYDSNEYGVTNINGKYSQYVFRGRNTDEWHEVSENEYLREKHKSKTRFAMLYDLANRKEFTKDVIRKNVKNLADKFKDKTFTDERFDELWKLRKQNIIDPKSASLTVYEIYENLDKKNEALPGDLETNDNYSPRSEVRQKKREDYSVANSLALSPSLVKEGDAEYKSRKIQDATDNLVVNQVQKDHLYTIEQHAKAILEKGLEKLIPYLPEAYRHLKQNAEITIEVRNSLSTEGEINSLDLNKIKDEISRQTRARQLEAEATERRNRSNEELGIHNTPVYDGGAMGGSSGWGRPSLRYVAQDKLAATKEHVVEGQYDFNEHQRYGANMILTAWKNNAEAFLLADGTGTGKSRIQLVAANEIAKTTGKISLIITPKKVKETIKREYALLNKAANEGKVSDRIDLGKIELVTWDDVLAGKLNLKFSGADKYGVVIYDEAHRSKNFSQTAIAAENIPADFKVFATATPMDKPSGAMYFLPKITGIPRPALETMLKVRIFPEGTEMKTEYAEDFNLLKYNQQIIQLRSNAFAKGTMLRRFYPFYGKIIESVIQLPQENRAEENLIENYWDEKPIVGGKERNTAGLKQALKRYYGMPDSAVPPMVKAMRVLLKNILSQKQNELSRWVESQKIPAVVVMALRELKNGNKVIIVSDTINPSMIKALNKTVPGFIEEVQKKLNAKGIKVSELYGNDPAKTQAAMDDFNNDRTNVLIMTPKSGGVGVSLDDITGEKPRYVIYATAPYAADEYEQVLGRASRMNTKSPTIVEVLFTNTVSDQKRRNILQDKTGTMQAIQNGDETVGETDDEAVQKEIERSRQRYRKDNTRVDKPLTASVEMHKGKNGNVVKITGDTFFIKDELKKRFGARWNQALQSWIVLDVSKGKEVKDFVENALIERQQQMEGLNENPSVMSGSMPKANIWNAKRPLKPGKPVPFNLAERIKEVFKLFNVPINEGSLRKYYDGVYKHYTKGVRVQSLWNIFTASHEMMHALDDRYKITDSIVASKDKDLIQELHDAYENLYPRPKLSASSREKIVEGLAVAVQYYLADPDMVMSSYPEITKQILQDGGTFNNNDLNSFIEQIGEIVDDFYNLTPQDKIAATIKFATTDRRRGMTAMQRLTMQIFNDLKPAEIVDNLTEGGSYRADAILPNVTMLRNISTIINNWIEKPFGPSAPPLTYGGDGNWVPTKSGYRVSDITDLIKTPSDLVAAETLAKARRQYYGYLDLFKTEAEIIQETSGDPDIDDKNVTLQALKAKAIDLSKILERNNMPFVYVEGAVKNLEKEYEKPIKIYDGINQDLVNLLEATQWISHARAEEFRKKEGYASYRRYVEDEHLSDMGKLGVSAGSISSLKKYSGSDLQTMPSITVSLPLAINEIIRKGQQNLIGLAWRQAAIDHPAEVGQLFEPILESEAKKHTDNVKMVMVDGEPEWFKTSDEVRLFAEALTPMQITGLATVMRTFTRMFQAGTTTAYAPFALINIPLDAFTRMMFSKTKLIPVLDDIPTMGSAIEGVVKWIGKVENDDPNAIEKFLALGGRRSTMPAQMTLEPGGNIDTMMNPSWGQKIKHGAEITLQMAELPTTITELIGRGTEYRRATNRGIPDNVAMFMAANVAQNFSNKGRMWGMHGAEYIKWVAYLGASIVALYQYLKLLKHDKKSLLFVQGIATVLSTGAALLTYKFGTEEEKDMLADQPPEEYARWIWLPNSLTGWSEKPGFFKLRCPEQLGAPNSAVLLWMAHHYRQKPLVFKEFYQGAETMLPSPLKFSQGIGVVGSWLPQAISPELQVASNTRFYPHLMPIVPQWMEKREEYMQYDKYSSRLAKMLGEITQDNLKLSPKKVDFYIRNKFGRATSLVQSMTESALYGDDVKAYIPITQQYDRFLFYGRMYNRFYDMKEQQEKELQTFKDDKNFDDTSAINEMINKKVMYQQTSNIIRQLNDSLSSGKEMSKEQSRGIYKLINAITSGENLETIQPKLDSMQKSMQSK